MTNIDKSPEQNAAEAADRQPYNLPAAIALHRSLYEDDNRIPRLTSRQPPVTRMDGKPYSWETQVGMPMSGAALRRIFEPWPGELYPWVTSFAALRQWCRRNHPTHRGANRPYWRGALCHQAVRATIILEQSPEQAAYLLHVADLSDVLRRALVFMEGHIDELQARAEQRAKQDGGVYRAGERITLSVERHDQPGMHRSDCPKCRREAA